MRAVRLAVLMAAMAMTHVAPASAEALAPAGLDGDIGAGGYAAHAVQSGSSIALNGARLLRVGMATIVTDLRTDTAPRLRRIASLIDFSPSEELGLHMSAGLRNVFRKGTGSFNAFQPSRPGAQIYTPAVAGLLPLRPAVARNAPAVAVGWMRTIAARALVGFEVGTSFDRGGDRSVLNMGAGRWSRVDPVGQASLALRF